MRVGDVGVGDGNRDGGPVSGEPAAEAVGVVAGSEIVVAGFGVAFFALEFVVLRTGIGVGQLAAVRIKVGVVADDACVRGENAGGAEQIFEVISWIVPGWNHGDALAAEENVFRGGGTGRVGFGEDVAA